jgi:hypothetical protein
MQSQMGRIGHTRHAYMDSFTWAPSPRIRACVHGRTESACTHTCYVVGRPCRVPICPRSWLRRCAHTCACSQNLDDALAKVQDMIDRAVEYVTPKEADPETIKRVKAQ